MITRCPSCHTCFRVRAAQLGARAGQVRCGRCSRVFNALEHLIEEIAAARSMPSTEQIEPARADSGPVDPAPRAAKLGASDRVEEMRGTIAAQVASGTSAFDFGTTTSAQAEKSLRRWPWVLGALLLLLLLLAQIAYHYRGTLVLLFPEVKPYVEALCARQGCELPLPRRIELISIESSDLQADTSNSDVIVLSATLKNRAIFAQQHPLLELTLTDVQDQPVVRRVLVPQDYLGKAVNAQAGFGSDTELAIKVFIEASQVKAVGYRLYLFYP